MADYDVPEAIANGTVEGPGGRPRTAAIPRHCACSCGQPVSPKSTFRQGHDQKLVGLVAYMVVDGGFTNKWVEYLQLPTEIDGQDIQERIDQLTAAIGKMFSEGLARKVDRAAMRAWQDASKTKTAKSPSALESEVFAQVDAERDERNDELAAEAVLGAPIRVKVGPRWEYDATVHGMNQSGKVTAVRYVPRSGKVRSKIAIEGQFTIV
jgi:hypothetical protein